MNTFNRTATVRFFTVDAESSFFNALSSSFRANLKSAQQTRILTEKGKKYLIKAVETSSVDDSDVFFLTLLRERNTWQAKASREGKITGITLNQGIIGDPYYVLVVPQRRLLLGLTTGPSGSLKSVGETALAQFNDNRRSKVKLHLIPRKKEFDKLSQLSELNSIHFKVDSSSLADVSDDAPQLIKDLSSAPYISAGMQLSLDLDVNQTSESLYSRDEVLEIINFLSDHDGCSMLKLKARDGAGDPVRLDFGNVFINYRKDIFTRNKFIDEEASKEILHEALLYYLSQCSTEKR